VPANTVDIYPTLLELTGARPEVRLPLDGTSLVPLIDGKMTARSKPMGFWDYPIQGHPHAEQAMDVRASGGTETRS